MGWAYCRTHCADSSGVSTVALCVVGSVNEFLVFSIDLREILQHAPNKHGQSGESSEDSMCAHLFGYGNVDGQTKT